LGRAPAADAALRRAIDAPYGVVIVTGPTGSGKTTTLYAVLNEINSPDLSIFTLEDPVEMPLAGIRQTQIKEDVGLTFSAALRSLLRQDPDVILVGEIRDTETATLMIRAALTGHLVFTTLHTNDAPGAIPRLLDMGVEPYLLPSSLVAIVAQRLVRKLCPRCRQPAKDPEALLHQLQVEPPPGVPLTLWSAGGCPDCHNSGFKGRQAIFEIMTLNEAFHAPIIRRAAHSEFAELAKASGMTSMFEDGMRRALDGVTTVEELLRVTRSH
jgi:type II secretory ATPase GspE/PulE/Tfp pilus assembly ATPase PilB-like protein